MHQSCHQRSSFRSLILAGTAVLLGSAAVHGGSVLHVDDDAPPAGDGMGWETAYRFLQDALAVADGGGVTEIHVAQGVYRPDRDEANPDGTTSDCCIANGGPGCSDADCEAAVCADLPYCCDTEWDVACAEVALDLCVSVCPSLRIATFQLINGVALRGGYAGLGPGGPPDARDPELYETILSGDLAGNDGPGGFENNEENSFTVVTGRGPDLTAALDGFTITGGNANGPDPGELEWIHGGGMFNFDGCNPTVTNCAFVGNSAANDGGGLLNWSSNPTIIDCQFSNNVAIFGAGLENAYSSNPEIRNCEFINNGSDFHGGGMLNFSDANPTVINCAFIGNSAASDGGGMLNWESNPTIMNCQFSSNVSLFGAGLENVYGSSPEVRNCTFEDNMTLEGGDGGGMLNFTDASPTVTDCVFVGNSTTGFGGGMYNYVAAAPVVTNCVFEGNVASIHGGGMHNQESSPTVVNCTFIGNSQLDPDYAGGGMTNVMDSTTTLVNCTFVGNVAAWAGGMGNGLNSHATATNCIFWGNPGGEIVNEDGSSATVSYSDIQGGYAGAGNIDADPMFLDPDNGDVHLSAGSSCIDAGDNDAVPGSISTDLDGNPRFVDDPDTDDTGNGDPPVVDMGAYEFQPCPCDCEDEPDGTVDAGDFLALLAQWGGSGSCDCEDPSDNAVDAGDFLALLAAWGGCP